MVIGINATKNMYRQLLTMITMLKNTQSKLTKIYAFIEDDVLSNDPQIEFINVSNYEPLIINYVNKGNWATYMTMARCYYPWLLPNEARIIYLDLDIMIEEDISEFWNLDLQGKEVAGVVDTKFTLTYTTPQIQDVSKYINAGVLLMDLDKIRENHTDIKMHQLLHSIPLFYLDQDCINLTCDILIVDCRYNSGYATVDSQNPLIYHVIQQKPWNPNSPWYTKWLGYYNKTQAIYEKKE